MKHAGARVVLPAVFAFLTPAPAGAHAFIEPYVLPVPIWMYLYGCAAVLVVSFAVIGYFMSVPDVTSNAWTFDLEAVNPRGHLVGRWVLRILRAGSVGCLLLTITAGLIGTGDPYLNVSITLFWIVFLLAFAYLTAVVGNVFECINPWKVLVEWAAQWGLTSPTGRIGYPERLGYYPAFVFYIALLWLELFVLPKPYVLSMALVAYSVVTFAGVWLFGKTAWLRYGEIFSVFFTLIGTLAPVEYTPKEDGRSWRVRLRPPFAGVLRERPEHMSLVLFVVFMLSSTTYDALHNTVFWMGLYWNHLLTWLQPLWGTDMIAAQARLTNWYVVYQRAALLASPFVYLGIYLFVLVWTKMATKTAIPLRVLARRFAFSLIPIAFVYNATHYYTMVLMQGRNVLALSSDPFGFGWNLLGIGPMGDPPPLNMNAVWHTQVALILAGHIVSVYLAHMIALDTFASRRQATVSQVPMLLLMVAYTGIGLWVLSLPLAVGG